MHKLYVETLIYIIRSSRKRLIQVVFFFKYSNKRLNLNNFLILSVLMS